VQGEIQFTGVLTSSSFFNRLGEGIFAEVQKPTKILLRLRVKGGKLKVRKVKVHTGSSLPEAVLSGTISAAAVEGWGRGQG
jgi:hypothetical protein